MFILYYSTYSINEGASVVIACTGSEISSLGVQVAEGVCSGGRLDISGSVRSKLLHTRLCPLIAI